MAPVPIGFAFALAWAAEVWLVKTYYGEVFSTVLLYRYVFRLGILNLISLLVWTQYLYPQYFSPLRHLPAPKTTRPAAKMMFSTPRGSWPLTWMKTIPNNGLLRVPSLIQGNLVIPTSPRGLADILSYKTYDFEKPYRIRDFLAGIIGWGLIMSEAEQHKIQRKALLPAFNVKVIRDLYPLMWEKSVLLLKSLEQEIKQDPASPATNKNGEPVGFVEMSAWASRLTLDIIGPTAMGRDFGSLSGGTNPVADAFTVILEPTITKLMIFASSMLIPRAISRSLPLKANADVTKSVNVLRTVCRSIVKEKKASLTKEKSAENAPTDVLSTIMRGGEFDDEAIVDQMLTFLAAGHETTASALTWCCYLLSSHPEIQAKLRKEIRDNIPSTSEPVNPSQLEGLPYLNGVCNEVLRLFPTVPTTIREAIRDTQVDGQFIPKGTVLLLVPYAINRLPDLWGEKADAFMPERWIDIDEKTGASHPNNNGGAPSNYAQITFLHGPRACIGQGFAKAELRCAVAAVVGKFGIEMKDPDQKITIMGAVTTKPKEGMHLKLTALSGW